jgi:hypothetical protein
MLLYLMLSNIKLLERIPLTAKGENVESNSIQIGISATTGGNEERLVLPSLGLRGGRIQPQLSWVSRCKQKKVESHDGYSIRGHRSG